VKKQLLKTALTATLLVSLGGKPAAAFDMVFDPTLMANNVAQLSEMASQLAQLEAQVEQAKNTYGAMTGKRGYGSYMTIANQARNYLPKNYSDIMGMLTNSNPSYQGMSDVIRKYIDANAILTNADLDSMKLTTRQRQIFTDSRSNTAAIQTMANEALQNASVRFNLLQSLAFEINNTTDPKAIAELQARIQVEQTMLTNEQNKLQDISDGMQAKKEMIDQQAREVAIQQTGNMATVQQPDLSNIRYGYNN
jgi:type IV secretion system protein VirB5